MRWSSMAAGLLLAGGVLVLVTHGVALSSAGPAKGQAAVIRAQGAVVGQPAPNFALPSLSGQTVSLAQFRGREPVYLNFWTTWCTYCKQEIPVIEQMQRQYGAHIAIFGVDLTGEESSVNAVRGFARHLHMNYPVLLDTSGQVADNYLVHSIPTTVVIGRNGTVTAVFVGEATPQEMRQAITGAIGGTTP